MERTRDLAGVDFRYRISVEVPSDVNNVNLDILDWVKCQELEAVNSKYQSESGIGAAGGRGWEGTCGMPNPLNISLNPSIQFRVASAGKKFGSRSYGV